MVELTYFLMISFLLPHEMDAALRKEWRALPLTSFLPETAGRAVFLLAHVPLILAFFWFDGFLANRRFAMILSLFAVIHVGLHWIYRHHPYYEFNNAVSVLLIWGAGVCGLLHLLLVL